MTISDEVVGRADAIICESRCVSLDDLVGELDGSMRPSHTVHRGSQVSQVVGAQVAGW